MNFFNKTLLSLDPAHLSLRNAVRGTVSVVISFILASKMHPALGFLGGLLGMLSSILINDPTQKEQKKTFLLLMPISICSVVPSVLLHGFPELRLVCFLLFTFMAIYFRRLGVRWIALGFISFMSYFAGMYFPLSVELIPQIIATVVMALSITFCMRFFVFPDRPEQVIKSFLRAFNQQYAEIVAAIEKGQEVSFLELNELTLVIEGYSNNGDSQALKSRSEALQMALFDREIGLQFEGMKTHSPITLDDLTQKEIAQEIKLGLSPLTPGLSVTTRMAIQATIASGLASLLGMMVSMQRWYWAPLTAFVLFAGASRGDTLMRASFRVIGTVIGLVLGILATHLIDGNHTLSWSLIILCVFLGIFCMRFTYGFWTATIFSFLLPLLFGILGQLTNELLWLRLQETLIGAAIGSVVSALILPLSTRKAARAAMARVLKAQISILDILPLDFNDKESKRKLVGCIRTMDREFAALKIAAAPYTGRFTLMRHRHIPILVHDVTALGHYIRHLATNKTIQIPNAKERMEELKVDISKVAVDFESNVDITLEVGPIVEKTKGLL
jgi:uncharacterized membrane protein YccC